MEWFYLKKGRQYGPVAATSIRNWLESGFLTPDDLLWRSGLSEWTPIHELAEFGGQPSGPDARWSGGGGAGQGAGDRGGAGPEAAPWKRGSGWLPDVGGGIPPPAGIQAYAGFWLRAAAYLLDSFLLGTLLWLYWAPRLPEAALSGDFQAALQAIQGNSALMLSGMLLPLIYFTILESSPWQASLGKKLFRIKVTDLEGYRLPWWKAALRQLFKILLLEFTLTLSCALAGFTPRKQALHDMLTRCLVVRG